jgi:hypothetical protein
MQRVWMDSLEDSGTRSAGFQNWSGQAVKMYLYSSSAKESNSSSVLFCGVHWAGLKRTRRRHSWEAENGVSPKPQIQLTNQNPLSLHHPSILPRLLRPYLHILLCATSQHRAPHPPSALCSSDRDALHHRLPRPVGPRHAPCSSCSPAGRTVRPLPWPT